MTCVLATKPCRAALAALLACLVAGCGGIPVVEEAAWRAHHGIRRSTSRVSLPIVRDDMARIAAAMQARACPPAAELYASSPGFVPSIPWRFGCVCWVPSNYLPISSEEGPAGPGCVTVRAEASPRHLAFFETAGSFGEREHEMPSYTAVLGSLDLGYLYALMEGLLVKWAPRNLPDDGWLVIWIGRLRFLNDDCSERSPEEARDVENILIRWLTVAEPE